MKTNGAFYLVMLLLSGCNSHGQNEGIVIVHNYFYGSNGFKPKPMLDISYKIWFKDNRSIQEVPLLIFTEDSSGRKTSYKIKHHSYLDPDENVCYNYESLSDSAKVINHYSDIDSVRKNGGWNFYSKEKFQYDSATNLSDTVINNITYGRMRLDKVVNGNKVHLVIYSRADKKGTLIRNFKQLSDSIGCPVVRDDSFIKNKLFMTRELEFVTDKLSLNELNVFEAWEKKAKRNPIK